MPTEAENHADLVLRMRAHRDERLAYEARCRIAEHVVIGFENVPWETENKFLLKFHCGGFAVLLFPHREADGERSPFWATGFELPCEICTLLRAVAAANDCVLSDAEAFL